jgi:hypothetical protein
MAFLRRALAALAVALAFAPAPLAAQFGLFGPNKVQYRRFDWRILRGEHVDLYHYPEEDELARVALTYAEDSYRELEARFRHSVPSRIPLLVYASHYDFEQTNLLPFNPPEQLLGFTEFARSRVVLPFTGNYAEFRHTIRHELVHVFQLASARLNARLYPRMRPLGLPLWWSEGTAEYFSAGEDTQDEMLLRDITQGGRLPTIAELEGVDGGIVYPIGGTLVRHLAETYGEWRIIQVFDDAWKYDSFTELLEAVFGRPLDVLTAEWQYAMRRKYYPLVATERPLAVDAHPLAPLALKPAVWLPPGDTVPLVFYISPRTGYTNVYAVPLTGGKARTIVKGERTPQFESFHSFDSRMDVSRSGVLVFASRYMDRDALTFWSTAQRRLAGRYQFPDIVSILSPAFSPDEQTVAFSGLSVGGSSDLYLLHLSTGRLERLTSDRYNDTDPSFSPDGTRLVFSSDRTAFGQDGATNLFVMDLATRSVRYLTYGDWHDKGPRWSDDQGRITFTSDRRGVQDIYVVDSTGSGRRESGVPGGVYDPVWVPSAGKYVIGGFEGLRFNIYTLRPRAAAPAADSVGLPEGAVVEAPARDTFGLAADRRPPEWRWAELDDPRYARTEPSRYEQHFNVDFAGAEAAVAPGNYSAQGAQLVLSDLLADHLIFVSLLAYQQGGGLGDLISNLNGSVTYVNQTRRLNWGVGAFRVRGTFYENTFDRVYQESATGAYGLLQYPLSRFTRIEGRVQLEYSDRTDLSFDPNSGVFFPQRRGILTANSLSYVHDNALWLPTGPIDGGRERYTGGIVTDLQNARFDSWVLSADVRRYLRTGLKTAVAVRGFVYWTGGERPQWIALGGTYGLRGYPRYTYVSGSQALMFNAEWRFPLTDYLSFGLPFGELRFPGIEGAVFADAGRAWTPQEIGRGTIGAYGFSFRMNVGFPLVLRLDAGWRYGAQTGYQLPFNYRNKSFVDFWFGFDY